MLIKLRSISREVVSVHICGNVSIDPSAVIAPGVLLQAEANSQIKIAAGVCIGAGTILQAAGGNLYIEAGVCIGRGVLIVGNGSIDRDACIGAGTTAIDPHIEVGAVIPPNSLIGDRSRSEVSVVADRDFPANLNSNLNGDKPPAPDLTSPEPEPADLWDSQPATTPVGNTYYKAKTSPVGKPTEPTPTPSPEPLTPPAPPENVTSPPVTVIEHKSTNFVAGRDRFDRMKLALFPNSGTNDYTA
jgi:carbon dioxide concentrating mechanism protein CcmN